MKMRRAAVGSLAVALLSALAFAQTAETDVDGMTSLAQLSAVYPDLLEQAFAEIDANGDGPVDESEMAAAVDAGTLVRGG
jgi:hypothetical protein